MDGKEDMYSVCLQDMWTYICLPGGISDLQDNTQFWGGEQNEQKPQNKTKKSLQQSLPLPAGITVCILKVEGKRSTSGQTITIVSQKNLTTSLHETEANQWGKRRLPRAQI